MVLSIMAYSLSASLARNSNILFHTPFLAQREKRVYLDRIAKALRQITPRDTRSVAVEHRFHEQPVVLCRDPDMALAPRQHILDPIPLIVPQPITTHRSAPFWLTVHESHMIPRGNPLIEDRP